MIELLINGVFSRKLNSIIAMSFNYQVSVKFLKLYTVLNLTQRYVNVILALTFAFYCVVLTLETNGRFPLSAAIKSDQALVL